MNRENTLSARRLAFIIFVFTILQVFSHTPATIAATTSTNTDGHTPSGFIDSNKNILYVESSTTPNVEQIGIIPKPVTKSLSTTQETVTLGPNLINNPSFEDATSDELPFGWNRGGYGVNVRELTYSTTTAQHGSKAAQVTISSLTSGDAKWFFNPISILPNQTYQFSNYSLSDVSTEIDAQITMNDGTYKYIVLTNLSPSSTYQNNVVQFTTPANAIAITIFHLIEGVGTLTVDNYSLNQATITIPPQTDIISNGSMEISGTNGPKDWSRGGWGTNNRTYSYPVAGVNGSKASQVEITNYTSGDAKWYFNPINLPVGTYTYSDAYTSDLQSIIDIQYHNTDGSYTYKYLVSLPPSSGFTQTSIDFSVPSGVQDVTIFHLIEGVGTLTVDYAFIVSDSGPKGIFKTGAVTLTFDDGWLTQYTNATPLLNSAGLKGTFYITTRQLFDYEYSGFLSKNQIQEMYNAGHEIGAHTQTHPYLTKIDPIIMQQEISGSRQDLLDLNVGPITSFAYPYGAYSGEVIQVVKDSGFTSARSTIDNFGNPVSDPYQLPDHEMINTTTLEDVRGWIDQALAQKTWLILEFHKIDNSGTTYSVSPELFGQVIDYIVQKNVPVVTVSKGIESLEN